MFSTTAKLRQELTEELEQLNDVIVKQSEGLTCEWSFDKTDRLERVR
jgi:hypothetical protein